MILKDNKKTGIKSLVSESTAADVLILDPDGKLKPVKWRFQSDGIKLIYSQDLSVIENISEQKDIKIILLSVSGFNDLETLRKLAEAKMNFEIDVITGSIPSNVSAAISSMGITKIISRPVDYPRLSSLIKDQCQTIEHKRQKLSSIAVLKQAITEPSQSHSFYKQALDHIKSGILMVNSCGQVVFVNRPLSLLLKVDERDSINKDYKEVLNDSANQLHKSVVSIVDESINCREALPNLEIVSAGGSQSSSPYEIESHLLYDQQGEFSGMFIVVEDKSKDRDMGHMLIQSEKLAAVGQLAAGAAHEIRNPLTSVKGFIQLLKQDLEGTPKADYINIIITEIDRVNNIINEFLKLAKPTLPNCKSADLRDLIEEIRFLVESEAFLKKIDIIQEFPEKTPLVQIDREQVKQVMINIIRNSFDAMENGGVLRINAVGIPDEKKVCLQVSDTGNGIDPDTLPSIFVPFFTTKDHGTGLGLSLSSQIMENHGGQIEVKSERGKGTTVCLYFPC